MIICGNNPYEWSRVDIFAKNLLERTNTGSDDFLFIEPYSAGDVFHTLSFLSAFRAKYCKSGQNINMICNPRGLGVVKLFRNVNTVLPMNLGSLEYHLEALVQRFPFCGSGVPIVTCPDMHARGFLSRLCQDNRINGLIAKKLILELELDEKPSIPELDDRKRAVAEARAAALGLTSGSVIIFNHASSVKSFPHEVFKALLQRWRPEQIFYDCVGTEGSAVPWAKPITMDIEEIPYLVDIAGAAVTIRSGITDILSACTARIITLYPTSSFLHDWHGDKQKVAANYVNYTLEKFELDQRVNEYPVFLVEGEGLEEIKHRLLSAVLEA